MRDGSGSLANQIFEFASQRNTREKRELIDTLVGSIPILAELAKGLKKGQRLKFIFNDEIQKKIDQGIYHIMQSKKSEGLFKAVAVDSKGSIKALADLKWEDIPANIDISNIISSMQGMAIQKQIELTADAVSEAKREVP